MAIDTSVLQELVAITGLSILVSGSAVAISGIIGIPLGIRLAHSSLGQKRWLISTLNMLLGLPPVLLGLLLYLLFSSRGPLGWLDILFTPFAMLLSQVLLTLPIIVNITRSVIKDLPEEKILFIKSLGADRGQLENQLYNEAHQGVLIALLTAFGRAISEVGAVLIVGGNIKGRTRVLTTAIATETQKGNFELAMSLGVILLLISLMFSSVLTYIQFRGENV